MKKILVPIDSFEHADSLLQYAVNFSQQLHGKLLLFHTVSDLVPVDEFGTDPSSPAAMKAQSEMLSKKLASTYNKMGIVPDKINCDYIIKFGSNAVTDILEFVQSNEVDLIIMHTRGTSGFRRIFFGSTTANIISRTEVPVLVLPRIYKFRPLTKLIYACDLENVFEEYQQVERIAERLNTSIEIVNFNYGLPVTDEGLIQLLKTKNLKIKELKRDITLTLVEQMRDYMKKKRGCIFIMFTTHRTAVEKLLIGSYTSSLIEDLNFPLLSIPRSKHIHQVKIKPLI